MNTHLLKKFTFTALLAASLAAAPAELKVGEALPDLASYKLEGTLPDSLKGKVVLVDLCISFGFHP